MMDERRWIQQLKSRSSRERDEGFECIYQKYYRLVFYVIRKYIRSHEMAEDVAQTVFLKFYQNCNKLRENDRLGSYLATIARNEAINEAKKQKENVSIDEIQEIGETKQTEAIIFSEVYQFLSLQDAHIVTLKIYYGYTFQEIATFLEEKLEMVSTRYYRALETLRSHYTEVKR